MQPVVRKRLLAIAVCLCLAIAVFLRTTSVPISRTKGGPRTESVAHLATIGVAIRDYTADHGTRPQKLSDLVPGYIQFNQIGIFYVKSERVRDLSVPPDWASNPSKIDQHSSYVYLGTNTGSNILAFEKLDLWKSSADRAFEVAVLFSDFHVQFVPISELQKQIPSL